MFNSGNTISNTTSFYIKLSRNFSVFLDSWFTVEACQKSSLPKFNVDTGWVIEIHMITCGVKKLEGSSNCLLSRVGFNVWLRSINLLMKQWWTHLRQKMPLSVVNIQCCIMWHGPSSFQNPVYSLDTNLFFVLKMYKLGLSIDSNI